MAPFKGRDVDPYTRVENLFAILVQSSIDQISKDLVEGIDRQLQMNLLSDWTRKTQNLLTFNKQFISEKDPFGTTPKPETPFLRKQKQELIREAAIPCTPLAKRSHDNPRRPARPILRRHCRLHRIQTHKKVFRPIFTCGKDARRNVV